MARILLAWELGKNLNHIANLAAVARAMTGAGHQLGAALRELHDAPRFFSGVPLQYYQAPFPQGAEPEGMTRPRCFAHLLYSAGFADAHELAVNISAWRGVFESFRPDLVVFEHSPTALLASRAARARRLLTGSGVLLPVAGTPLGVMPDVARDDAAIAALVRDEQAITRVANTALGAHGIEPVPTLETLYREVDGTLLFSFPELDAFERAVPANYLGVWSDNAGAVPKWPGSHARRVFAYLSPFAGFRDLIEALRGLDASVLVHARDLKQSAIERLTTPAMSFTRELLDLDRIAAECDLFISHGAHRSVCQTLLAGVAQLVIPLYREQEFTGRRLEALGAGLTATAAGADYAAAIDRLLTDPHYREGAQAFAARNCRFDADASRARIREIVGGLLAG